MRHRRESKPKGSYFRRRGWKDLIFVIVVTLLGWSVKRLYLPTDFEKWERRPALENPNGLANNLPLGLRGMPPCFSVLPHGSVGQPVVTASVDDCVLLVPNGRNLNLYEIELWTGRFLPIETDLYLPCDFALAFTRTYRPLDEWARSNQDYLPNVYGAYLWGHHHGYTDVSWYLPDGLEIYYRRISKGTSYEDAVFDSRSSISLFHGSRISWNGWGWDISLRDGKTYLSPEAYGATRQQQGSIAGIFDSRGQEIRLSRRPNGDLLEIKSADRCWIQLSYDHGRIAEAKDSSGQKVKYNYDSAVRPNIVAYSTEAVVQYAFDSSDRIIRLSKSAEQFSLENRYDAEGRVIEQTSSGLGTYRFRYSVGDNARHRRADVIDPTGRITQVEMQEMGGEVYYTVR